VAFRAIVAELGVRGRDFAGVEKTFVPATREKTNREQAAENCEQADDQSRASPRMQAPVVTEIAFVTLGDLLLRATGFRHVNAAIRSLSARENLNAYCIQV